jgi:hypothetical protein
VLTAVGDLRIMPPEASLGLANILRNMHVVSLRSYPQETADLDKVQRHASTNIR